LHGAEVALKKKVIIVKFTKSNKSLEMASQITRYGACVLNPTLPMTPCSW